MSTPAERWPTVAAHQLGPDDTQETRSGRGAGQTGYLLHLIGGLEGFDRTLKEQGGGCAICGRIPDPGQQRAFHVDHDHSTGMVRGVLCGQCNVGLGYFADDEDSLTQAIMYLRHWRSGHWTAQAPTPDYSGPGRRRGAPPRPKAQHEPIRIVPRHPKQSERKRKAS